MSQLVYRDIHRHCFITGFIIIIDILVLQFTISSSLILNHNTITNRWNGNNILQVVSSSSVLHSKFDDDTIMPPHESQEEEAYSSPPTLFNRRNYGSKRSELSERNRKKLKALTSFGMGDDEWDEYANIDFDNIENSFEEPNNSEDNSSSEVGKSDNRVGLIKPKDGYEDHVQSQAVTTAVQNTPMQNQAILNNISSQRNLEHDQLISDSPPKDSNVADDSINEFRKKYKTKADYTSNDGTSTIILPPASKPSTYQIKTLSTHITNEQIDQIKSSVSIVDVIESYNLPNFVRTNARSAKACCPFHNDNNPSMSIDDNRGLYKCFACGAGGDLFNFIREYHALLDNSNIKKEKMGFMEAVQYAAREFGDGKLADIPNLNGYARTWENDTSDESRAKIMEQEKKKDRIRQANNAAAAFYTKCLVTLPTAGKARAYLRSRNILPDFIRYFALGYSPDCYYGDESTNESAASSTKKEWGGGSLVKHLSEMGFTPSEMVEAGLAVRTNSKSKAKQEETADESCDGLMDRFRNRLVVPIFDKTGKNVIGFGGRHLESIGRANSDTLYTPAKYINSPESCVFKKKFVLFNENNAKIAIEEDAITMQSSEENDLNRTAFTTGSRHLPIIIVEGYFDAISLASIGVKNVVASMGTALNVEQLKGAANMVDSSSILLCMDNDDAGRNSIERICSSNLIMKTPELGGTQILVATLPDGVKDPSDFVASNDAKVLFESKVLQQAQPWDEWYIRQLVKKHDDNDIDGKSFAAVCEDVSSFLATFPTPVDRTRRVHNVVDILIELIAKDSDNKSTLGMMRVQLESDMMNMVSRKASIRESMERRIEEKEGYSEVSATLSKMDVLTRGELADTDKNALAKLNPPVKRSAAISKRMNAARKTPFQGRQTGKTTYKTSKVKPPQQHLIPHFNGFTFKHKKDQDWLGVNDRSKRMYLGSTSSDDYEERQMIRAETTLFDDTSTKKRRPLEPVYFNSNEYIGERYLTSQAMDAGYLLDGDSPKPGESLMEFTDRMLLERDADEMILLAESRLLHSLAKFTQAREIMRTVYSASTFTPPSMQWTCEERQWLFQCLTGISEPSLPRELLESGTASQLRSHLVNLEDCPTSAFISRSTSSSTFSNTSTSDDDENIKDNATRNGNGHLETYFMDANHLFPSFKLESKIAVETRAELTVQETVATLLRATAIKRFLSVKSRFAKIVTEIDCREELRNRQQEEHEFYDKDFSDTSYEELQDLFDSVAMEVMEAQRSLYESDRSADRVNAHLLDYGTTNSVQYRTSNAEIERLEKMMDEHISSLPEDSHRPDVPGDDNSYVFGLDEMSEQIDPRYGGKDPDFYTVKGLPNGETKWN